MGHMGMHHKMGHGHKEPFTRKLYTKEEKKEWLSNYIEELRKELNAAEEKLNDM